MRHVDVHSLPGDSACAAVARSCQSRPEFLLAADGPCAPMVARWRFRQAWLPQPVRMSDHLLWFCESGGTDAALLVGGVAQRMQLRPGSMGLLPAAREAQWRLGSPTESVFINVYLPPLAPAAPGWRAATTDSGPQPGAECCKLWLRRYCRVFAAEYERCLRGAGLQAFGFLDETANLLVRHVRPLLPPAAAPATRGRPNDPRVSPLRPSILRRVEAFVEASLNSTLSLQELAALASMSIGHFVRAFRNATGVTPYQYILERRLDRACSHLLEGTERVSVVAKRCGFGNAAHFSAMFHARLGCSPSDFRRRL